MHKNSKGISLIEALITLLVLSTGLLGLGQLQARLWSTSGRLHATDQAYLLGARHLEILVTKQLLGADLLDEPAEQTERAGTRFNTTASVQEGTQLVEIQVHIEWQSPDGSHVIQLESGTSLLSHAADTRQLMPGDPGIPLSR
ncbi:MAG TPA: hypothetical protein ENK49_09435 [Gammaproteobacteria bacterium]|nr:hypothetical protein [Gammaproteobacteria bacterium]